MSPIRAAALNLRVINLIFNVDSAQVMSTRVVVVNVADSLFASAACYANSRRVLPVYLYICKRRNECLQGRYNYIDGTTSCNLMIKLRLIEKDARYLKKVVLFKLGRERSHDSALVYMSGIYKSHKSTFLLMYSNRSSLPQSVDTPLCF
jgi:hypothetical protein